MTVANKVTANPVIGHAGALGYLLWLRRDLPAAYVAAARAFPQVAAFEAAISRSAAGLGDDGDISIDVSSAISSPIDAGSAFDSSASLSPVSVDYSSQLAQSTVAPSVSLPPIAVTPDANSTAADIASSTSSSLASIGSFVAKVLPTVITAGAAVATAVIKNQTASKAQATAALQLKAAQAGLSPYQTGYVATANGGAYLAPIQSVGAQSPYAATSQPVAYSSGSGLSAPLMGIPLYIWLAGGLGLVALLAME